MGPYGLSNKIPRKPCFQVDGHGETRRCEGDGGREGEAGEAQSGVGLKVITFVVLNKKTTEVAGCEW